MPTQHIKEEPSHEWQAAHDLLPPQIASFGLYNTQALIERVLPLLVDKIYCTDNIKPEWHHWLNWFARHRIEAITCPFLNSDGEFKEHTVIRIPALPITVYHLNTRSPFPDARPMATTCVMQHDSVPHVPSGCVGQAPVPSILPMACLSWESTHHDPHGIPARSSLLSWPPPQPHAASITLVRKWQTRAVDPEKDGACRIDFEFTIPFELPSVYHTEHYCTKYFHVAMQQVENPHTQAHSWPPPRIVRWEFRASHQGAADPFLDIVLSFELPQG